MTAELWFEVLGKLGGTAGLIIIVAIATWKAFQALSGKWLDNRFAEKLKKVEQQHDVMARHLQSSIDREFDRATKLHASEFDALTDGWAILHETYWRARDATGRGYQIHDLSQMGEGQLAKFIDNLDFPDWQKEELRQLPEDDARNKYYQRAWRSKQHSDCFKFRTELLMFVDRKAIFMQPEIKDKFVSLHRLIDDALLEFKLRIRDIDAPINAFDEFIRSDALRDGESQYLELEKLIHTRLWSSTEDQQK